MSGEHSQNQDSASAADIAIAELHEAVAQKRAAELTRASTAALATLLHALSHSIRTLVAISPTVTHNLPDPFAGEARPVDALGSAAFTATLGLLLAGGRREPYSLSALHAYALICELRDLAGAIEVLGLHDPITTPDDFVPPPRTYSTEMLNHLCGIFAFISTLPLPHSDAAMERAAVSGDASLTALIAIAHDLDKVPIVDPRRFRAIYDAEFPANGSSEPPAGAP